MNNLILCSRNHKKYEKELVSSLKKNKIKYKIYYDEENNLSLEQLSSLVKSSSHFTIVPKTEAFESGNLKYILGFLTGTKRSILLYNADEKLDLSYINKKIKIFDKPDNLDDLFLKEKKIYLLKRRIRYAKRELEKMDLCLSAPGMFWVVDKGLSDILKLYLMAAYSPDLKKKTGLSLMGSACRKGHVEIVKMLIKAGADINIISDDRGNTPVMDAASEGHDDIIDILIQNKAELNEKNKSGQTALILAIGASRTSSALKLIEAGADISVKDALGMDAKKYAELFKNQEVLNIIA